MQQDSHHRQIVSAVTDGWMEGGAFFGSIIAGVLVGLVLDRWLGTEPWLVIAGIGIGSYSGFLRVWHHAKRMEDRR